MRALTTAAAAALAARGEKVIAQLIELELDSTVRATTAGVNIVASGQTWQRGQVLGVSPIEDGGGELRSLTLTLPGVTSTDLSLALTTQVDGKRARVFDAILDASTHAVLDVRPAHTGTLNPPSVSDLGDEATLQVDVDHRGIAAIRTKRSGYNNDEQQRLNPGDTSFNVDPATDAGPVVWPKATWNRK